VVDMGDDAEIADAGKVCHGAPLAEQSRGGDRRIDAR
jgi:hypothetical protein